MLRFQAKAIYTSEEVLVCVASKGLVCSQRANLGSSPCCECARTNKHQKASITAQCVIFNKIISYPEQHTPDMLLLGVQFIYDTWYGFLTPDREFPADVRRALNSAFGELAARARLIDLRAVLRWAKRLVFASSHSLLHSKGNRRMRGMLFVCR